MAYASTRLGHVAANQWEQWNISNVSGEVVWTSAIVVGASSGATAIMVDFGIDFSYNIASIWIIRYNGTAFTNGETCNVYTVNGGASQGTFTIAAGGATATAIHPVVVVTGTDTANLYEYVYSASVAGGWGYHSTNNTWATLNCSIIVGDPYQVAVTTAVSKNESVKHNGNLMTMGNSTYATTFTIGEGTYGDVGSTRNGCIIENDQTIAPTPYYGAGRYAKLNVNSSYINTIRSGWAADFTNVTTYEASNLGSIELFTFPIANVGKDGTDVTRLYNVSAGAGIVLSHGNLEFTDVNIGKNGTYGMIFFGPGDLTARNLVVLDSASVNDGFGFIAQGTKTFINCTMDETDVTGFWSDYTSIHQYTVDATCTTPNGSAVQSVQVRGWDGSQTLPTDAASPKFDVITDASGNITQQECTYATAGSPAAYVNLNPWTFFVNIAGMREKLFEQTLSESTIFELTMENVMEDFT